MSADESDALHLQQRKYIEERLHTAYLRLAASRRQAAPPHKAPASGRAPSSTKHCIPRQWCLRIVVSAIHAASSVSRGERAQRAFAVAATFVGDAVKPEHRHKADAAFAMFVKVLREQQGNGTLYNRLMNASPNRSMTLYYHVSDYSITQSSYLPVMEHCTSASATGIPVPDFTFSRYSALKSKSTPLGRSDWPSLLNSLGRQHLDLGWENRTRAITWRGNAMNEPAYKTDLPLMHRFRRSRMLQLIERQASRLAALGVQVDVGHVKGKQGFNFVGMMQRFNRQPVDIHTQCRSRYQLHVDGFSYAAALKYRLACGAVILRVTGGNSVAHKLEVPIEWFEAVQPLRPGSEYVAIAPDLSNLVDHIERLELNPADARRMSSAAAAYASRVLAPAAISNYLTIFLTAYAALYAEWDAVCRDARHVLPEGLNPEPATCAAAAAAMATQDPGVAAKNHTRKGRTAVPAGAAPRPSGGRKLPRIVCKVIELA